MTKAPHRHQYNTLGTRRTYFPGIESIRFYAALAVIIYHVEGQFPELRRFPDARYEWLRAFFPDAQTAVSIFFVLSGFLITFLLLHERQRTQTIAIRKFYVRRVLRIWPLYYLIVLLGAGVLPLLLGNAYHQFTPYMVFTSIVFMTNITPGMGPLQHLWSISVEEQFYLFWPWVVRRRDLLLKTIIGILILKITLSPVVASFHSEGMSLLFHRLRFDCMAIGGLGAILFVDQHPVMKLVYHPLVQLAAWCGAIYIALFDLPLATVPTFFVSVITTIILLNIAGDNPALIKLNLPIARQVGVISYGLYMYHVPLLYLILMATRNLDISSRDSYNFILYGLTISLALVVSWLSYRFFESAFLRLKTRFAVVQTRVDQHLRA